jgi:AraC-like DNA-binding protein
MDECIENMYYLLAMNKSHKPRSQRCWYSKPHPDRSRAFSIEAMKVRERMDPIFVNRPAGLNSYLFIHFHDAVDIWLDGNVRRCPRHTLVIWPPDTKHYFGNASQHWTHSWMYGGGGKMETWLVANGLALKQPLVFADGSLTDKYLTLLYAELHRHARPDELILESLYSVWLRELARATQTSVVGRAIPPRLLLARQHLENNLARRVTLRELARIGALSVSQFSAVFKKHFGKAPIDYLLALRMRQAMYHLSDLSLNVTEVGRKVGFEDPFYFSKQFKRHFGVSPRHYRKAALAGTNALRV